jgi:FecR protein
VSSPTPRPTALPFAALAAAGIWLSLLGLCVLTFVVASGRAGAQGTEPALAGAVTLTFRPPEGTLATAQRDLSATLPPGSAVLTELANSVEFRSSSADALSPAYPGLVLGEGGELQAGPASAARLDFDDGAVVRLGPNTMVSLEAIAARAGSPSTRLGLQAGQVWADLRSRPLEVSTVLGTGAAHGAFAEFVYQPGPSSSLGDDVLTINCFKGPCSFASLGMNEFVGDLTRLTISGETRTLAEAPLTAADVQTFIRNNPEGQSLTALLGGGSLPTQPVITVTRSLGATEPLLPTPQPTLPAYPGPQETARETSTLAATPTPQTPTATVETETPSPTAGSETPGTGTPGTGTPETGTPGTGTPQTGTPGTGTPTTGTPGTGTPGTGTPATPSPTPTETYPAP